MGAAALLQKNTSCCYASAHFKTRQWEGFAMLLVLALIIEGGNPGGGGQSTALHMGGCVLGRICVCGGGRRVVAPP